MDYSRTDLGDLSNDQIQVLLTGTFGDGSIQDNAKSSRYSASSKMKGYLEIKKRLLGDMCGPIHTIEDNGFSKTPIHRICTKSSVYIKNLHSTPTLRKLFMMDDLGFAMWLYDDGSLHKNNKFYNINTHAFSEDENRMISSYINDRWGLYSRVMTERKKDGRVFYYLFVPPAGGAYKLSSIMSKLPVEEYSYKLLEDSYVSHMREVHNLASEVGFIPGTEEHFEAVKSYNLSIGLFRRKNPNMSLSEWRDLKKI